MNDEAPPLSGRQLAGDLWSAAYAQGLADSFEYFQKELAELRAWKNAVLAQPQYTDLESFSYGVVLIERPNP